MRLPPEPMAMYSSSDEDEQVASCRENKAELATEDIVLLHKKKRYSTGHQVNKQVSWPFLLPCLFYVVAQSVLSS